MPKMQQNIQYCDNSMGNICLGTHSTWQRLGKHCGLKGENNLSLTLTEVILYLYIIYFI